MDPREIVLTCDDNGQQSAVIAWNLETGAVLKTYRGNANQPRSAALLGGDYIITAQKDKPLIQTWTIHGKGQIHLKMVCAGRVTTLCATPDGVHCIAGIGEKIHVWQVATGNLLAVVSRHFQSIRCLRTNDDGSYFLSGGDDGLVHVWRLSTILSEDVDSTDGISSDVHPVHTWTHHSLPVTDIHVGHGLGRAKVATCSLDQTCKFYELLSGQLLLSVAFEVGLTAVTMDSVESNAIVAGTNGKMFVIHLFNPPRFLEHHYVSEENPIVFEGHEKPITDLTVSEDGTRLLSGSLDGTAKLWDVASAQCIRTFSQKGPVTNAIFAFATDAFFVTESRHARQPLLTFKRNLRAEADKSCAIPVLLLDGSTDEDQRSSLQNKKHVQCKPDTTTDWKLAAAKLSEANREMYEHIVERIFRDA